MSLFNHEQMRSELASLASTGISYSNDQESQCLRYGMVIWQIQRDAAAAVLASHPGLPHMLCYSSDATSFLVRGEADAKGPDGVKLQRRGRDLQEFLMQRGWAKLLEPDFTVRSSPMLAPPRPAGTASRSQDA